MNVEEADVLVVGGGPAGWAIADQCARHGLDTLLAAPRPAARWPATYGLWADQCAALPGGAAVERAAAVWAGDRRLGREYVVLDNDATLAAFAGGAVRTTATTVTSAELDADGSVRVTGSAGRIRCRVAVDASGQRRVLSGGPPPGPRTEQTAYGVIVSAADAAPLVRPGEAVFMRWATPTFLYAVPLPGGGTLVEETSLARRPGAPAGFLKQRLHDRLAAAGIGLDAVRGTERVRFALDVPRTPARPGVAVFGVAAGMMHPATGYSVGDAFATAPAVAAALAAALPRGAVAAARAAEAEVWPPAARAVHRLRRWGLRTLLSLPPARVPEFFDTFFAIPERLQHAYLSGRADLPGTLAAMSAVFTASPWPMRTALAGGGRLLRSGHRADPADSPA